MIAIILQLSLGNLGSTAGLPLREREYIPTDFLTLFEYEVEISMQRPF
jgi:hypothetical protein